MWLRHRFDPVETAFGRSKTTGTSSIPLYIYIFFFSIYIAVTFYISPHSETQASARKEKKFTISVCRRLPSIVAPIPFFILGESSMPSPRRPSKVKEDRVYCREGN